MLSESEVMAAAASVKAEPVVQDELEILFKEPKVYRIGDEEVQIRTFTFGELPRVIALLRGVGGTFAHYQAQGKLNSTEAIMDIVATGGENLIATLAINVGRPREWFDTLPADTGIQILFDFLKMNIGFFTRRVVPILQGMK